MNIVCILAGGIDNQFGSPVPKQYHPINGRTVIEYAIDAAIKSISDEVIVVANGEYLEVFEQNYGVIGVKGGRERNESIENALKYVNQNYRCEKIILLEGVCPLVTTDLLNLYFGYLDEYEAVFTTQTISTSLARYDRAPVMREEYFLVESPDAYQFRILNESFDVSTGYTTPLHMLPKRTKIKYYYDFKDYLKIIEPHDLAVAETLLKEKDRRIYFKAHANDLVLSLFAKLRKMNREGTKIWEKQIDYDVEQLFTKWQIYNFSVNPDAYTGLVLECKSREYGEVVIKIYPPFLNERFIKESFIMKTLKDYPQAALLDMDAEKSAMLIRRIIPGDYIDIHSDCEAITVMFRNMIRYRLNVNDIYNIPPEIKGIIAQTDEEYRIAQKHDYNKELLCYLVKNAHLVYDEYFKDNEKFLLHGDAYFKNALRSGNGILVIDPVGYQDVFEFEYMPMLTYELAIHTRSSDYVEVYKNLILYFSRFADVEKFNAATFVFLVKQLIPSVYEANDGYQRADIYLELIRTLYLVDNETFDLQKCK